MNQKQSMRLSNLINQALLAAMGVLFCILACRDVIKESIRPLVFAFGIILIIIGIVRVWLIRRLFQKIDDDDAEDETDL